jgi:RNA polymerase sigma factor (sigma-70 family)
MIFDHDKNNKLFLEFAKDPSNNRFELFYKHNHKWLELILTKSNIDEESRFDLMQEIWLEIRDKSHDYNPILSSVRTWIYRTIAQFKILGYYRDSQRKNQKVVNTDGIEIDGDQVSFLENLPAEHINTFQDFDRFYLNYMLRTAISKIKRQDHQRMILLHYFGGLSYKHIAVLMKENYNNIRVWNHRASSELSEIMKSMGILSC